jgi:hypothetical protein
MLDKSRDPWPPNYAQHWVNRNNILKRLAKSRRCARENNQAPVLGEIDQPLQVEGVVALGGIARASIVGRGGSPACK